MATRGKKGSPTWTVLVYLAGDNNLTEEMAWGLQELKKTASRLTRGLKESAINVVAHFDPRGSRGRRYDFAPATATIGSGSAAATQDGDLDSFEAIVYTPAIVAAQQVGRGRPAGTGGNPPFSGQLEAFLKEQVRRLPRASEYFLVLSGHGSGAVGDFLIDSNPATSLSIPELADILEGGCDAYWDTYGELEPDENTRGLVHRRISILGMDTCLMSNAEVCFEIREHVRYLVASEGWVSSAGWPYHRVLEAVANATRGAKEDPPRAVAQTVAERYSRFYQDYEVSGLSTDIAVCDLSKFRLGGIDSLVGQLKAFSTRCAQALDSAFVQELLAEPHVPLARVSALADELSENLARLLSQSVGAALAVANTKLKAVGARLKSTPTKQARRKLTAEHARIQARLVKLKADRVKAAGLKAQLLEGSAGRVDEITRAARSKKLRDSQREALRELLEIQRDNLLNSRGSGSASERTRDGKLRNALASSTTGQMALAVVRVRREFDLGVLTALELIETLEAEGRCEATKARRILQKLHQVRSLLDLRKTKAPPEVVDDLLLRNAIVAARSQAQTFKAGVYVDLFDLCRRLAILLSQASHTHQLEVRDLCQQIQTSIEGHKDLPGVVLLSRYTGPAFQHAHGLSVYFPSSARDYAPEYENLQFATKTGWGRFVRAYLQATRRQRRDEQKHMATLGDHVLRFDALEVDPLESDGIEARIVGVVEQPTRGGNSPSANHRAGTEQRIKAGTEQRIKAGTEQRIKGEGLQVVSGNPPDGFFRQS